MVAILERLKRAFVIPGVDPSTQYFGVPTDDYTPSEYGDYLATSNGVYVCATRRAEYLSSVPLNLYRVTKTGRDVVETGELRALLDKVNPYWTFHRLISMTELSLCLWGSSFWFLNRGVSGRKPPSSIWWARPDRVIVYPSETTYISHYGYQPMNGGPEVRYKPGEVVWVRRPNPMDEFSGLSPLAAARLAADTASAAQQANRNLFAQGIQLGGIVSPKAGQPMLTDEQGKQLETQFNKKFKGSQNAHKWAIMKLDMQFSSMQMSPKDAEYLGALNWSLEEICRAYGVPLDLVGGQRTYANAKEARYAMWSDTVVPQARMIATELTEQLLPMFPGQADVCEFDFGDVEVLQEAESEKWLREKEQLVSGVIVINEWRKDKGLDPLAWGDAWWASSTLTPVEDATKPEPPAPVVAPPQEEPAMMPEDMPKAKAITAKSINLGRHNRPGDHPMPLNAGGIDERVNEGEYVAYGLRVSSREHAVGSTLEPSPVWEDGVKTGDYLDGTSTILVGGEGMKSTSSRALKLSNQYEGEYISLVGGNSWQHGEDTLEAVIRDPVVIYQWKKPSAKAIAATSTRMIEFGSAEHERIWRAFVAKSDKHERAVAETVKRLMKNQRKSILARLDHRAQRDAAAVLDEPFDMARWIREFRQGIRPVLTEIVADVGSSALQELSVAFGFDVKSPEAIRFLESRAQRFAVEVNQTTWDSLKSSLSEGIDAGEGIDDLAKRVESVMGDRIRSSAETIARTETIGAANGGTQLAWEQSEVVAGKSWLAALDDRTRETHVAAHTQYQAKPIRLNEDFHVGAGSGPHPGAIGLPEEDISCRCAMVPILDVDWVD